MKIFVSTAKEKETASLLDIVGIEGSGAILEKIVALNRTAPIICHLLATKFFIGIKTNSLAL